MEALKRARITAQSQSEQVDTLHLCNEKNERNELSPDGVETLRMWLQVGRLHALPAEIPGFAGELAQYADRDRLIRMVRAILDAMPWSLTAYKRAEQFVAVLAPLVERTK